MCSSAMGIGFAFSVALITVIGYTQMEHFTNYYPKYEVCYMLCIIKHFCSTNKDIYT